MQISNFSFKSYLDLTKTLKMRMCCLPFKKAIVWCRSCWKIPKRYLSYMFLSLIIFIIGHWCGILISNFYVESLRNPFVESLCWVRKRNPFVESLCALILIWFFVIPLRNPFTEPLCGIPFWNPFLGYLWGIPMRNICRLPMHNPYVESVFSIDSL